MPNPELARSQPFTIRGHHLEDFQKLVQKPRLSPVELSRISMRRIRRHRLDWPPFPVDSEYVKDVLGTTRREAVRFARNQKQAFETFMSLPDDFPVEIIQTKDVICNGCAAGNHCKTSWTREGDRDFIEAFLECLGIVNQVSKPKLPDPVLANRWRIQTTIGVVKKVLRDTAFPFRNLVTKH